MPETLAPDPAREGPINECLAQLLDPQNWEDADEWIEQHGRDAAQWLRTDPEVLEIVRASHADLLADLTAARARAERAEGRQRRMRRAPMSSWRT